MSIQRYLLSLWLLIGLVSGAQADTLRDFVPGSYQQILASRQGQPFIMVLWSIDCAPCHKELAMLGQLRQQRDGLDVIFISTDEEAGETALQSVLARHQLQNNESWVFAAEQAERLRYEIDITWYGELPRSYLFDRQHRRQVISGLLSEESVLAWLKDR